MDLTVRYFLRRLAMARRDPKNSTRDVAYSAALAETILIFVGLPGMALFSWIVIVSLRHLPTVNRVYDQSPRVAAAITTLLLMIGGYIWFRRRIKPYYVNSDAYRDFDSEVDRRIIFWQKVGMTILCGVVLPWVAILLFLVL